METQTWMIHQIAPHMFGCFLLYLAETTVLYILFLDCELGTHSKIASPSWTWIKAYKKHIWPPNNLEFRGLSQIQHHHIVFFLNTQDLLLSFFHSNYLLQDLKEFQQYYLKNSTPCVSNGLGYGASIILFISTYAVFIKHLLKTRRRQCYISS